MLAAIIPRQCLVDLAKKVHRLRIKWKIQQHCHQSDEIQGLFAKDEGFLGLQVDWNRSVFMHACIQWLFCCNEFGFP